MKATSDIADVLEMLYPVLDGNEEAMRYSERHGIRSLAILTITSDEKAALVAEHLADRIRGKVVIEIGGGIGLLAFHLSQYAERVLVFEANPMWTSVYVAFLHSRKPKNVTFMFGAADEFAGQVRGDVALFCTHSDASGMRETGLMFAPEVIDVYGEIIKTMEPSEIWPALVAQREFACQEAPCVE
jgi:predicted RNA methylase